MATTTNSAQPSSSALSLPNPISLLTSSSSTSLIQRSEAAELESLEDRLFTLREKVEVIWIQMGRICAEIAEKKLYKYARDENGNYFRTAQAYFKHLDQRFHERGMPISSTTLNKWVGNHRLFIEQLGLTEDQALILGKSNLEQLAPAVRKLVDEGKPEEAKTMVMDLVAAAEHNGGLPVREVAIAIDEQTGRVNKGLSVEFVSGRIGKRLAKLTLWWGERPIDMLTTDLTEEQEAWVQRRMGIKPS